MCINLRVRTQMIFQAYLCGCKVEQIKVAHVPPLLQEKASTDNTCLKFFIFPAIKELNNIGRFKDLYTN